MGHEGKCILKTDDAEFTAVDAVSAYKELPTVEWAVRDLKDVMEGRSIFHQTDERVKTHIPVGTFGLFLRRALEHQLAPTVPELSSTDALVPMKSIGIAELGLNGLTTPLVSGGRRDARRVLSAPDIKDIEPPNPENPRKEPQMWECNDKVRIGLLF